ncbi:MAG: hypothetical protein EBZ77_13780, partial [Chitinophagia bacterium]|nr:hypothetical protein [Chitinophagia bacterium]
MNQIVKTLLTGCFVACSLMAAAKVTTEQCMVTPSSIVYGYYTKKVWLSNFEMPVVKVTAFHYIAAASLPPQSATGDIQGTEVVLGIDKKRPFAIVR